MTSSNSEKSSLLKRVRAYGRTAVQVGSKMADVVVHLRQPSPVAVLSVGAKLLDVFDQVRPEGGETPFPGWVRDRRVSSLSHFFFTLCCREGLITQWKVNTSGKFSGLPFKGSVHDVPVGWFSQQGYVDGPYIPDYDRNEELLQAFGRVTWESLGPHVKFVHQDERPPCLVSDPVKDILPSKRGRYLYEEFIAPYRARGRGRTVLFYGESGVGKSTLMRYIAKLAGGFTLRISGKEFDYSNNINEIIQVLRPSAVLLDDLDNLESQGDMLLQLEDLRKHDILFMASVNDPEALDHALLRAGRFDEYILIDSADEEIVEAMVKNVPPEAAEILRSMPIAYIDAYKDDVEVLGPEKALERIGRLKERHLLVSEMAAAEKTRKTTTSSRTATKKIPNL